MPLAFASSPVAPYALATKVEGRIAMLCFQLDQRSEAKVMLCFQLDQRSEAVKLGRIAKVGVFSSNKQVGGVDIVPNPYCLANAPYAFPEGIRHGGMLARGAEGGPRS
jgi:hypothetical protein